MVKTQVDCLQNSHTNEVKMVSLETLFYVLNIVGIKGISVEYVHVMQ